MTIIKNSVFNQEKKINKYNNYITKRNYENNINFVRFRFNYELYQYIDDLSS